MKENLAFLAEELFCYNFCKYVLKDKNLTELLTQKNAVIFHERNTQEQIQKFS